jgi:hypothetical protein
MPRPCHSRPMQAAVSVACMATLFKGEVQQSPREGFIY